MSVPTYENVLACVLLIAAAATILSARSVPFAGGRYLGARECQATHAASTFHRRAISRQPSGHRRLAGHPLCSARVRLPRAAHRVPSTFQRAPSCCCLRALRGVRSPISPGPLWIACSALVDTPGTSHAAPLHRCLRAMRSMRGFFSVGQQCDAFGPFRRCRPPFIAGLPLQNCRKAMNSKPPSSH